jgi:hypothetical protein
MLKMCPRQVDTPPGTVGRPILLLARAEFSALGYCT